MKRARRVSPNPPWRRLYHTWQRLLGHERFKSNKVSYLEFVQQRYKQVRFPSVAEARRVEGVLRTTAGSGLFPILVHRLESTLWVRFVAGTTVNAADPRHREAVYGFFASLYAQRPRQLTLAETDLPDRLRVHIETLAEVGRLDDGRARRLLHLASALEPQSVWFGLEYVDSLQKNLIVAETGAVGIDIEAAWDDQLLGIGVAKARLRWLDRPTAEILERLTELGAPDLREQYPYADLIFLAQYAIQSLFRGKPGRVPPRAFDALLAAYDD